MSNGIIMLSNVRLSFPHLIEPQKQVNAQTGKERVSYNAEFIMPSTHPGFQQFMTLVGQMAVEKWKENANNVLNLVNADRKKRCYGNGAEKINQKTFAPYDGYVDNVFITAGRDQMPQMIQADGTPVDAGNTMAYQALARAMYGGCRVNVALKPWLQDNTHGKGVRCDLVAIQFAGDDTPFGEGAVDASGLFGAAAAPTTGFAAAPAAAVPGFMTPAPQAPAVPGFMAPPAPPAAAMPPAPFAQAPTVPGVPSFLQ